MQQIRRRTGPNRAATARLLCLAFLTVINPLHLPAQEEESGSTIVPLPALFFEPETGFAFGMVVGVYGAEQASGHTPEVGVSAIFTKKKQILLDLNFQQYPSLGKYWISGRIGYQKFPTKHWGLGNNTPDAGEENYTPRFAVLETDVMRRVGANGYLGVTVQGRWRRLSEVDPTGTLALSPGVGHQSNATGVGFIWTNDSRDKRLAPTIGAFYLIRAVEYADFLTNVGAFRTLAVDLRQFFSPMEETTLAFRASWNRASPTAPFDHLPVLGGSSFMRGYFEGRFRDANAVGLQSGFRFPITGILRGAVFADFGQVADQLSNVSLSEFKTAMGGGIRIVLDRRSGAAIRIDYGWAFDVGSGGLYFGLGEAF